MKIFGNRLWMFNIKKHLKNEKLNYSKKWSKNCPEQRNVNWWKDV